MRKDGENFVPGEDWVPRMATCYSGTDSPGLSRLVRGDAGGRKSPRTVTKAPQPQRTSSPLSPLDCDICGELARSLSVVSLYFDWLWGGVVCAS